MISNIEIEAKVLLSKEQYDKVYKSLNFKDDNAYTQVNYYIDSKDRTLKENDVALRIREKKGVYVLTLKTPLHEGLLEKNQELSAKEALEMIHMNNFPNGDIQKFLETLDIDTSSLVVLATMTTLRNRIDNLEEDEELSLDVNRYGDKVDYELEVDRSAMSLAEERIAQILQPLKIKYTLNHQSKSSRAINDALSKK
jgi:uncharacterized protein YjbK